MEILTSKVVLGDGEVSPSNAITERLGNRQGSRGSAHAAMRVAGEQISDWLTPVNFGFALADELPESVGLKMALESRLARHATRRRLAAVVVLHLRSRYDSKAAILTIPVQPVPVENRSPA